MLFARIIFAVLPLVFLSGCPAPSGIKASGQLPVYPVVGQVTLDGVPIRNARIAFHPLDPNRVPVRPVAISRGDGTYTLSTYGTSDGAPLQEYTITVVIPNENLVIDDCACDGFDPIHDILGGVYMDPTKSSLRGVVRSQCENNIPIRLITPNARP